MHQYRKEIETEFWRKEKNGFYLFLEKGIHGRLVPQELIQPPPPVLGIRRGFMSSWRSCFIFLLQSFRTATPVIRRFSIWVWCLEVGVHGLDLLSLEMQNPTMDCRGRRGFPGGSDDKESTCNAGDMGSIPETGLSPGEGNGNPLQYSCLGNTMDRGAWHAIVHGAPKSQTRLSDWTQREKNAR